MWVRAALNERCDTKIKMCVVEVRGCFRGTGFKRKKKSKYISIGVFLICSEAN